MKPCPNVFFFKVYYFSFMVKTLLSNKAGCMMSMGRMGDLVVGKVALQHVL